MGKDHQQLNRRKPKEGPKMTTDIYTRRKHTGLSGNPGKFAEKVHDADDSISLRPEAEAAYEADLREINFDIAELKRDPDDKLLQLHGGTWKLPDWEITKEYPEWVDAYARESVWRYCNRSERDNPELLEDLKSTVLVDTYEYAKKHKIKDPGQLVGYLARVTVGKSRGDKNDHTSDRYARQILADRIHTFTQDNHREPTSKDIKALANDIRENWEVERVGYSTSTRPPRVGFADQIAASSSFDKMMDGGEGGEMGDTIALADIQGDRRAEDDRKREVTRGINQANAVAGKFFLKAKARFAEQEGRELTSEEEDALARYTLGRWPKDAEFQPNHDFHRRSASFYESPVKDWTERLHEVDSDPAKGGKRLARVMIFNALSESYGCAQVQVGCMTRSKCERIRKVVRANGVMQTISDWEDGLDTKETKALWTPWPGISEVEKSEIASTFRANARHAEGLWDSAVGLANPNYSERIIGHQGQ